MKKHSKQQLVQLKTLHDSNNDDVEDATSTSSESNAGDSDHSSRISDLMRENERKIRNLSDSYMHRFLMMGQQSQLALPSTNGLVVPTATNRSVGTRRSSVMESEVNLPQNPSFNLFIETLKQLIMREERKREKCYLPPEDERSSTEPYTRLAVGITQCLRDYEAEINHAKQRLHDLNEQQEHILRENKNVVSQLTEAFEQNTITLRQTYEKRLAKQREESVRVGQSLDNYKTEILTIREAYEKKLRVKDELITELNDRLAKNETEQAARHHALQLKIEHFQKSFETLQARNKQIEQNNQIKTKENQDLLQQIASLQTHIQRLQQTISSKANECTELSQKLAATMPKLAECERFGSELQQWFSTIVPDYESSGLTLDQMSRLVAEKASENENSRRQLDFIREELENAHLFTEQRLTDRVKNVILQNKQVEAAHHDISNKYQALLLQTNMLTGIIKQHSTEVANHKTNEEQLKEFNDQLLSENQMIKVEIQEYRSRMLQITNVNSQNEHEFSLIKQQNRDLQIQCETLRAEHQMLSNEIQTKRETIKRYEQEINSMKQLFDVVVKEKQIQSDQLKHERQLFQSENDTLKQLVIRDGHEKQIIKQFSGNYSSSQRPVYKFSSHGRDKTDDEVQRISKSVVLSNDRIIPLINRESETHNDEMSVARRATSTPTPRENEPLVVANAQSLGITKQIDQVLSDMKNLLQTGRQNVHSRQDTMVPERDRKLIDKTKSRRSKKERMTISSFDQH